MVHLYHSLVEKDSQKGNQSEAAGSTSYSQFSVIYKSIARIHISAQNFYIFMLFSGLKFRYNLRGGSETFKNHAFAIIDIKQDTAAFPCDSSGVLI